jgi:hypothetical protein
MTTDAHTRPISPVLRLTRWLVVAYAVAMLVRLVVGLALFPRYAETHLDSDALNTPNVEWTAAQTQAALQELGWPATTMAWVSLGSGLLGVPVAYLVLFLLLWRGAMSWFRMYVAFICATLAALGETFAPVTELVPALAVLNDIFGAIGWQLFFIMFFFFPNGRPVPGWARWLAWLWGGLIVLEVLLHLMTGTGLGDLPQSQAVTWLSTGLVFTAIGSQGYRYFWRSDAIQRQQIKWVMYTLLLIAIVIGGVVIPFAFRPPNPSKLGPDLIVAMIHLCIFRLSFALVFAAIGIAILRYRLFDIDVIIRRTLQYSAISSLLALTYFGIVVVLQRIFTAVSGQQSAVAIVLSTLVIAALFNPVRRRVQDAIDRRFYRKKYDAAKVIAEFAATCRDETDLDKLTARLVEVVQETMQPTQVSLWLKPTADRRRLTTDAAVGGLPSAVQSSPKRDEAEK